LPGKDYPDYPLPAGQELDGRRFATKHLQRRLLPGGTDAAYHFDGAVGQGWEFQDLKMVAFVGIFLEI